MHRKRNGERRRYNKASIFPLVDTRGCIVAINRSHQPDRRLDSYQVTEIDHTELVIPTVNDDR